MRDPKITFSYYYNVLAFSRNTCCHNVRGSLSFRKQFPPVPRPVRRPSIRRQVLLKTTSPTNPLNFFSQGNVSCITLYKARFKRCFFPLNNIAVRDKDIEKL